MIRITLANPSDLTDTLDFEIDVYGNKLARDWKEALKVIVHQGLPLEKDFCFLGFPKTHRTIEVLCDELNEAVSIINRFNATEVWQKAGLEPYVIEEWFTPQSVRFDNSYPVAPNDGDDSYDDDSRYLGLKIKHDIMNQLHNHFERLQGTVWEPSDYYKLADSDVRKSIGKLNLLCHELESLILSMRKVVQNPAWVRPSQINSFAGAMRYDLTDEHRELFDGTYDRKFGEVYMHWCQIGKTLMEVYRDEGAPALQVGDDPGDIMAGSGATCEAINSLRFYSGEFDIEWAQSVTYNEHLWHKKEVDDFRLWMWNNHIDPDPKRLSLGYLPIAKIDTMKWFGSDDPETVWDILSNYLNVYKIQIDDKICHYKYLDSYLEV